MGVVTMTTTGRQLIFRSDHRIDVEEFEVPDPEAGQVLVETEFTHVSAGTEMNFFRLNPAGGPLVREKLGYMQVGTVAAVGPGAAEYAVGDRVVTNAFHQSHWIVDLDPAATSPNGSGYIERVPVGVPGEQAGFITLGDVALHGLRRAQPQIDQSGAVIGCGMVGQLVIQLARVAGMHPIVAVDLVEARLERARVSGATHLVDSQTEDMVAAVREATGGAGAEIVFPCAPVPTILQPALEMAAKRGTVSLVASIPGTAEIGLQVELLRKELSIIGTYEADMMTPTVYWPWTRPRNRRAILRMLQDGRMSFEHLITHVVPYTEAERMFAAMHDPETDWMGVVFDWR
jgi:threonine dehydrogenase-like Zn-dependent dehydrogenase